MTNASNRSSAQNSEAGPYEYTQSTQQAFYFIESSNIDINYGDWILAYNNDVLVGARQWNGSMTDVPVMGNDGSMYTQGYIEPGFMPQFKVLNNDTIISFEGDIPAWNNNQISIVSTLTEIIKLPTTFSLDNAYPNPFNPITTINFALPISREVSISIYDLHGRKVTSLINGIMDIGYHSVMWNADAQASGVYFVKMIAGEYVGTQQLMLVK